MHVSVWGIHVFTNPWAELPPPDRTYIFSFLAIGFTLWTLLFLLCRFVLFGNRSCDFSNRIVSVIHCVFGLVLSTWSVSDWLHPLAAVGGPNTPEQTLVMWVSLSYFLYDMPCCAFEVPFDVVMAIHHVFTILGFVYGIISGHSGPELVSCLWLTELSSPCMHTREIIKEMGAKESAFATLNNIAFAIVFTFARVIVSPFVVTATLRSQQTPLGVKMGAVAIQLVSLLWFYKILRIGFYKVLKKGGKKKSARSQQEVRGKEESRRRVKKSD